MVPLPAWTPFERDAWRTALHVNYILRLYLWLIVRKHFNSIAGWSLGTNRDLRDNLRTWTSRKKCVNTISWANSEAHSQADVRSWSVPPINSCWPFGSFASLGWPNCRISFSIRKPFGLLVTGAAPVGDMTGWEQWNFWMWFCKLDV